MKIMTKLASLVSAMLPWGSSYRSQLTRESSPQTPVPPPRPVFHPPARTSFGSNASKAATRRGYGMNRKHTGPRWVVPCTIPKPVKAAVAV